MNKRTRLEEDKVYKQSKAAGYTAAIGLVLLISSGLASASPLAVTNTFQPNTPATAASVNQNFSDVEAAVNDNDSRITDINDRLGPVEDVINGQVTAVDCGADAAALKNMTLTPNTTYVLTGICDGQIIVGEGLGTINIEGDGVGGTDGITLQPGAPNDGTVFAAIYGNDGVILNLTNLTINVASYNSISDLFIAGVGSYWGANVTLNTVDVVGGDQGISAYNNGMIQVEDNVTITGFRDAGILASRGSIIRVYAPVTVTGGSNQEGSNSEAIVGLDGGVVAMTGGGNITPASGTNISVALDSAAALSAFRNGVITVVDTTLNGTVWSGESSTVDLRNVTQSNGNIDAYRNSVIRVRSSNVTSAIGDAIFSGVFSTIRMDDTTVGNASGTESIGLYNFGVIDLRGTTDLANREINCFELREVRIRPSVTNVGSVNCGP